MQKSLLEGFGSNTSTNKAMLQLQDEVLHINSTGKLSIPDAQVVKRATGGMGAWQYGSPDPESTAREAVYNAFYRNLKEAIEKASPPGVKEINAQMQELIPVMNALIRRIPVAARNNAMSLSDIISLSAAAIDPRALGVTLLNFGQKSGNVMNFFMQQGQKVQNAVPTIGNVGGILPTMSRNPVR